MTEPEDLPTRAEHLAAVLTGNAETAYAMATVQRSHRFPMHIFAQIENMAKMAGAPVSLIINELLECGLDAVKQELPEDVAHKVIVMNREQVERPTVTDSAQTKKIKPASKAKLARAK